MWQTNGGRRIETIRRRCSSHNKKKINVNFFSLLFVRRIRLSIFLKTLHNLCTWRKSWHRTDLCVFLGLQCISLCDAWSFMFIHLLLHYFTANVPSASCCCPQTAAPDPQSNVINARFSSPRLLTPSLLQIRTADLEKKAKKNTIPLCEIQSQKHLVRRRKSREEKKLEWISEEQRAGGEEVGGWKSCFVRGAGNNHLLMTTAHCAIGATGRFTTCREEDFIVLTRRVVEETFV